MKNTMMLIIIYLDVYLILILHDICKEKYM